MSTLLLDLLQHVTFHIKKITPALAAFFFIMQWLKCRPDGTIVAKLKYRPDGISLKKSAVPARRHCICKVVVPSRPLSNFISTARCRRHRRPTSTERLRQLKLPTLKYRRLCAHQALRLFSSGHLAGIPIAVASGFIAGTAPVVVF